MATQSKTHFRSISLPSRSHPSTIKIEEEITKIKAFESTSGGISSSLSGLEELYQSLDEVLTMASTQQVLSKHQDEKCVDELLDASLKLLDVCGIARDNMLQIKEQVFSLQSAIRRRKGDSSIESAIIVFNSFRKKAKKEARKLILSLKQMENRIISSSTVQIQHQDPHFLAVIRVLREINAISISIFQSLYSFLAAPCSAKQTKWFMVSKLKHKGVVANEQGNVNEFEGVDAAISRCGGNVEKIQVLQKRLEALESCVQGLENGLECVFRRLIKTRASLLNIISQ